MVKEGAAALGRAYQVEPEVLVTAFAGSLTDVTMPKGLASTPDIDKMVDSRRNLVAAVVKDEYLHVDVSRRAAITVTVSLRCSPMASSLQPKANWRRA